MHTKNATEYRSNLTYSGFLALELLGLLLEDSGLFKQGSSIFRCNVFCLALEFLCLLGPYAVHTSALRRVGMVFDNTIGHMTLE